MIRVWLVFAVVLSTLSGHAQNLPERELSFNSIVQARGVPVGRLAQRKVKIAFATPLKQVSDYWRRSIDSFKGRMDELQMSYEVIEFSTRADESRKLKECVQLALKTSPDYLVVTPNDAGDEAIITRLLANRRVKVIIQNTTLPNDDWRDTPPFMYVGFDHVIGTTKLADEFIRRLKGKSDVTYAMLYFVRGSQVSKLRGDRFNQIISKRTRFKLVSEFYTGGTRPRARDAALKILAKHPKIDFIYACSTDVAFGALDALKSRGMAKRVLVNGWGGGAGELNSIMAGDLDFTVMRMNDDNGVAMAEAVRLDLQGEHVPLVYSGDMVIVTQGIDRKQILLLKKRSFRYSGN